MFRIWGKIMSDNHLLNDYVAKIPGDDTRTHKVFAGLEEICKTLEITSPIWLESNIKDFKKFSFVRFTKDNFVESIDFDYLEIRIIEED